MQIASEENLRGGRLFHVGNFPKHRGGDQSPGGVGVHLQNRRFRVDQKEPEERRELWGMGAYTRANAEVCLLGVSPGFKAREQVHSHRVHQVIEAPFEGHSKKPDETRRRIVELLGDVPRLELFARDRAPGWDAWGNEVPPAE